MRTPKRNQLIALACTAVFSFSLAACGGAGGSAEQSANGQEQVTFQMNWVPGGFNAGFALAKERGYYEDEGMFVSIVPGNGSSTTAQLVSSGNAEIAYADATPVTQLIAKDAPMKVISTLYQAPPAQVTALADSGIESLSDLQGKRVATATGAAETPMVPLLLDKNNIDPESVELVGTPEEALVPQLIQGNVDAILGSMDFYGIQLSDRGIETVNFPFYKYGVATVSTSIVASDSFLEENPEAAKGFVAASIKGWEEALKNPKAAIDALVAEFPDVDPAQATKELEATRELFCANGAEFIGKASPEAWERHQQVLEAVGSLPEGVDPTEYYTYDYLPPESQLPTC
jgi:NitT/TauT family transport system substrate-binding protein